MKQILKPLFLFAFVVSSFAAFEGPGASKVTTVKEALKAADDTPCVLEGNILEKIKGDDDEYLFSDGTGKIKVDIDDDLFGKETIKPETKVRITGEVEKESFSDNEIDVKKLEILK